MLQLPHLPEYLDQVVECTTDRAEECVAYAWLMPAGSAAGDELRAAAADYDAAKSHLRRALLALRAVA